MTLFKRGDVILIPFPFTNLSGIKQRPAVVVSSDWYNKKRTDIIIASITSQTYDTTAEDEYLFSPEEQKLAGLPKRSIIKLGKLVTIDQRLVKKKIGHISEKTQLHIKDILHKIV